MALKDILIGLGIIKRRTPEEIVDKITENYSNGNNNIYDPKEYADTLLKEIDEEFSPNERNIAMEEIMAAMIDNPNIPDDAVKKVAEGVIESDVFSSGIVPRAIERSTEELPSNVVVGLMEKGQPEFSVNNRLQMLKNVTDKESFEEAMTSEKKRLLKKCEKCSDEEIVRELEALIKLSINSEVDYDINSFVEDVIAYKMAHNYYIFGFTSTSRFANIVVSSYVPDNDKGEKDTNNSSSNSNATKDGSVRLTKEKTITIDYPTLLRDKIADKVEKKYEEIVKKEGKKKKKVSKFSKKEFRLILVGDMGKWIGGTYKSSDDSIAIPEPEQMKKLTKEEKNELIKQIQIGAGRKFGKREIENIKEQINANMDDEKGHLLIEALQSSGVKEDKIDELVKKLVKLLSNPEELETILMMQKKGLISEISSYSREDRSGVIETFAGTLANRSFFSDRARTNTSDVNENIGVQENAKREKKLPPIDGDPADGK